MRFLLLLPVCSIFLCLFPQKGNHTKVYFPGNNDTLQAEVSYGSDYLLNKKTDLSNEALYVLIDSLNKSGNKDLASDLLFYLHIRTSSRPTIEKHLDSLFKLDSIPYGLINELNVLLLNWEEVKRSIAPKTIRINDNSDFPSNLIYLDHWNILQLFPYPESLWEKDTVQFLPLIDPTSGRNYHHPVSLQTIKKYGGNLESPFGWRDGKNHNGIDVALDQWDTIHATFAGRVRFARNYEGYGKVVVIRHYNGLESLYAHLAQIKVKAGQIIPQGHVLGLGGNTGNSTGSHLHFELRYKGFPLNPANIIDFRSKSLLADTLMVRKMRNTFVCLPVGVKYHTVERNDYPHRIAQRYGISLKELYEMNQITHHTRLKIGQKLRVSK
jgi:murein DD-endopeptidase MepM/ murein hydrolase activator NlpD